MNNRNDFSLDPSDWTSFRQLAHRALDDALDHVQGVSEQPTWRPVPESVRASFAEPLPLEGTPLRDVYDEFKTSIFPYSSGNTHPRFFGYVQGAGQAGNVVAEMLAAAMNSNCGGRDHGAIYVERGIIGWCKQLFGFPEESSGLLLSGTSMANLVTLAVARNSLCSSGRSEGFDQGELIAYVSQEAHDSVAKALEMLGMGSSCLHKVGTDEAYAIDVAELRRAIAQDREAGKKPFCVVGCAGTVNTGALDDLEALAGICAEEQLWFHVDGAFGAMCMLSDDLKSKVKGIGLADSLAFDFHKWAQVQYDAGCVLIRRPGVQAATFSMRPSYLQRFPRGLGGGDEWPCDLGPELSRSFRALKIWFALKEHGVRKLGRVVEQNCTQAQYLTERILNEPGLELLAPTVLNIVSFRVLAPGLAPDDLDHLNAEVVADVQESGIAAPSTSRLRGRLAIRVNITNHRTQFADLDIMLNALLAAAAARLTVAIAGTSGEK